MRYGHTEMCRKATHPDSAKRVADIYNLHKTALGIDSVGKWFAAALSDGRSDGELYVSKAECIVHQKHNEQYYTYIKITPASMYACDAEVMLVVQRRLYDAGMRVSDPDTPDVIKRLTREDQINFSRGFVTNLTMPERRN